MAVGLTKAMARLPQERTSELSQKVAEIEESVEEQVGALGEAFRGEFGEGMAKVYSPQNFGSQPKV